MPSFALKIVAAIAIAGLIGFFFVVQKESDARFNAMPQRLEDFTALNVDGTRTTYQDLKGKTTLIVLSASWCPACLTEIPTLKELYQEFKDKGFQILMISEDDNIKIANKFKKKYEMPWPVLHWNYQQMNALGNPGVIPVSYLLDQNDSIVKIHVGVFEQGEMRKKILQSL